MPGVWDALSARIISAAGFPTAFLSGFAVAGTFLGKPDVGYLTQTEMADVARRVCAAAPDLNVIVDADTGYGNAANVMRTVELWEEAGAHGMFLEDQVWPKKCGHMANKEVIPRDEWLAKLRAARDHRRALFLTARTDARAAVSLVEAIERGRMARDLGVDAVFVEAPESLSELETIAHELSGVTLVANMVEKGKTPLLTPSELAELGFRLIVSPLSMLLSVAQSLDTAARTLMSEGSMRDHLPSLMTFDGFTSVVGLPEHLEAERRYASGSNS
jgi:2-methylisocitrate lyase-like PEP mutase family enzyme